MTPALCDRDSAAERKHRWSVLESASRAKIELNGSVDRYAPAHIWGEANLLSATTYTDISMSYRGIDLTEVTPYSGHFAGYKIAKGKLTVDLKYHIEIAVSPPLITSCGPAATGRQGGQSRRRQSAGCDWPSRC
ncbi:MAG: DUF748 domain-containing protein [Steroidobacteraceae bacterium]